MGVASERHVPANVPPPPEKEIRYRLNRRLGGRQGRSGRVQEISPGLDPWTVQPWYFI